MSKILALFDCASPKAKGHDFAEEFKKEEWVSERQIVGGLRSLGHEVRMLGLCESIEPLFEEVRESAPDVVFNLLEEFNHDGGMVPNVVSVLEILGLPYTGCGPLGLRLAKDKALAKSVFVHEEIPTAAFQVLEPGKAVKRASNLSFPIVVKPRVDDASYHISKGSVVENDEAFEERVKFLHEKSGGDALAESYLPGRELYVSLLGRQRIRAFPLREVRFGQMEEEEGFKIASYKVKWDKSYRRKLGIQYHFVKDIEKSQVKKIQEVCRAAYRALHLKGYARVDLRLGEDGTPMVLEINPNPYLAKGEDFAQSAARAGLSWEKLLQSIVDGAAREAEAAAAESGAERNSLRQ